MSLIHSSAVQSFANPLPGRGLGRRVPARQVRGHHAYGDFEDMQEAAELEMLRTPGRRSGRSLDSERTFGY